MANDAIDDFFDALQTVAASITGVNQAAQHPPEAITDPPMAVCYPLGLREANAQARMYIMPTRLDILLARGSLPDAAAQARKYIIRGMTALQTNLTMSGTCETITDIVANFGVLEGYSDTPMIGVRFEFNVKLQLTDITPTA